MNIFQHFEAEIASILVALKSEGALAADLALPRPAVETVREEAHGDLATNVAMVLARPARTNPKALAGLIADRLAKVASVAAAEVAGPGFINMRIEPAFWPRIVAAALAQPKFGGADLGRGAKVNVEYVSANPTGPLHVGHCRGAVFGDALASLLDFAGYAVTREYYVNDGGAQVDVLARSAFLRYREALGEPIGAIPEGLYPGDYLQPVGEALARAHGRALVGKPEAEWLPVARDAAIEAMMALVRDDLAALSIKHDVFFSERSLSQGAVDKVRVTIEALRASGYVVEGRLPPPKGAPVDDWEDREQTLFRATAFGDDTDRALIKSDGSYTYFAADMAYHFDKIGRGFADMIDVWGADHAGHIKRMVAAVKAMSDGKAALDVKVCQLVKLYKNGEPYKMSKRAGTFVTLRDVVEEVGPDPVRFMMLYRKNDAPLDFDFAKVTEQSRDNPVFYVQYAHARAQSVLRTARTALPGLDQSEPALAAAALDGLSDSGEIALMRRIGFFPRLIEQAASAHEPHRIAFYLYDLASDFHALWNRGKDQPHLRFIREDDERMTIARLALVAAAAKVLSTGLGILGVQAPDEMR